jgi:mannose-6-phosphate isomerase-like protein (cupin superfamily)
MRAVTDAFDIGGLAAGLDQRQPDFTHFFRARTLSLTIASWPAGSIDDQAPHAEDEVYYVVGGSGVLRVRSEDVPVRAGSIVYVASQTEHRFHSIEEDLLVLVFWSPPRHVRGAS